MDDLADLYQEIILNHNRRPKNEREMEPHSHEAEGYNPTCGDRVTVYLQLKDGVVEDVSFVGEGCAISRASASIMTTKLKGVSKNDLQEEVAKLQKLLTQEEEPEVDLATMGDLAALAGVRKFPQRIKCATLAWHAAEEALDSPSPSPEA
ncbi:MAG: Fe-S cluster assembly sulfur transfer protein SufU [Verrucomicrobiota bacterium]